MAMTTSRFTESPRRRRRVSKVPSEIWEAATVRSNLVTWIKAEGADDLAIERE